MEGCLKRGVGVSRVLAKDQKDEDGFDVHQINSTYYSALGKNDDAHITARVLQLFTPGIPQVYYVGLLAGANDLGAVERTGEGREINRHNYAVVKIGQALERPVVQRLLALIRLRNTHPAFDGGFTLTQNGETSIRLEYQKGPDATSVTVDWEGYISRMESVCNGISSEFTL